MMKDKVQHLFDEPACAKNQAKSEKERRTGCSKPLTPGAAAGGCAFDGAKIALQPVTDVAHLVHGPIACEGNCWDNRGSRSSGPTLWRTSFTTDSQRARHRDRHGGSASSTGHQRDRDPPPSAGHLRLLTCVPALIGDDVDAVCRHAAPNDWQPVIPVIAPGFVGSKNLGNKLAGEPCSSTSSAPSSRTTPARPTSTSSASSTVGRVVAGDAAVRAARHPRARVDSRRRALCAGRRRASARVNMVVCTRRWSRSRARCASAGASRSSKARSTAFRIPPRRCGHRRAAGRARRCSRLDRPGGGADRRAGGARLGAPCALSRRLAGKRVLLYTGGVKSWSVVSALQEIGMVVVGTSVRNRPPRTRADQGRDDRRPAIASAAALVRACARKTARPIVAQGAGALAA